MTTATIAPSESPSTTTPDQAENLSGALSLPQAWQRLAIDALAPPAAVDLWSWCERHLYTPEGVRWDPKRSAVLRRWYKIISARITARPLADDPWAHRCEQIYIIGCTQLSKTLLQLATLCWAARNHPHRMAYLGSLGKKVQEIRKTRFERMVLATKPLERLLPRGEESRERALGRELTTLGTALVHWRCGSIADDLRSDSFGLLCGDEIETWPLDCDGFGDPIKLAHDRQRQHPRTKLFLAATSPGLPNTHGWHRLCSGSHERLLVLCPDCGAADWLNPRQISLAGGRPIAETSATEILEQRLARWACRFCGSLHDSEAVRRMAVEAIEAERWCPGAWAITADHPAGWWEAACDRDDKGRIVRIHPAATTTRSAHVNALYLPGLVSLDAFAAGWATALVGLPGTRKATINSDWAEPWTETTTAASTEDIAALARPATAYRLKTLDRPARWLELFFDQQGNHRDDLSYPWVLRAIEPGGESWLVDCGWAMNEAERDDIERSTWTIGGKARAADHVIGDSGNGNLRFEQYLWAAASPARRLLVRGDPTLDDGIPWKEVVDSPGSRRRTPKPAGVREYRIHPHHWRTVLWERITRRRQPGWWLPEDAPPFYQRSLTSEEQRVETRQRPGRGRVEVVVWVPRVISTTTDSVNERKDNHWWDAEAGILAAASILRLDQAAAPRPRPVTSAPATGGWMAGY